MNRKISITDRHPENNPTKKIEIEMSGGSPWYGYVWVNGIAYTIIEGKESFKFKRTR